MTFSKTYLTAIIGLLLPGCSIDPVAIDYGNDGCASCKMTIVDNRHAAQLVTSTGKAYKFDAVECMVNYIKRSDGGFQPELLLATTYDQPGKLVDVLEIRFLRSAALPSPMGMYITAFSNPDAIVASQAELGGKTYDWQQLTTSFDQFSDLTNK